MAAGRGSRFGGPLPKQYALLGGEPVLRHSLAAFRATPGINQLRVVIGSGDERHYEAASAGLSLLPPVLGGTTRQQSVLNGLEALATVAPDFVAIHDAARPFVKPVDITACLNAAAAPGTDGAVLGVRLTDTVKRVEKGAIRETVPRANLWRAQTPQIFRFGALLSAHRAMASLGASEATALTDDAAVAERAGLKVVMVSGSEDNAKITTNEDLLRAAVMETRTAFGFDVHGFGPGNAVMLGGVAIPIRKGSLAIPMPTSRCMHSPTPCWVRSVPATSANTSLLRPAMARRVVRPLLAPRRRTAGGRGGGRVVHLDLTLVCEARRIGPHRAVMVAKIARIAGIETAGSA